MKPIEVIKKLSMEHTRIEQENKELVKDLDAIKRISNLDNLEKVVIESEVKGWSIKRKTKIILSSSEVEEVLMKVYKNKIEVNRHRLSEIQEQLGVTTMTKDDLDF